MIQNQEIEILVGGEWKPALFEEYRANGEAWVAFNDTQKIVNVADIRPRARTIAEVARATLEIKKSVLAERDKGGLENHIDRLEAMIASHVAYLEARGLKTDFERFLDDLATALLAECLRIGGVSSLPKPWKNIDPKRGGKP